MSQILDAIPIHELTEDHLNSLQLLRVSEGPRLEYKAELKMSGGSENRELCKDISSLANSQGGYVLFGISELDGLISGIPGIVCNDSVQQQFFQIVTTGIDPRIQTLLHTLVPLRNGNGAFIVKIEPDGYLHQVKYQDNRFYKRTGTITIAMESADVETFFKSKGASNRKEEIEGIIAAYYDELRSKKYFKGVSGKGLCAMVIVPEVASYKLDLGNLPHDVDLLFRPIYSSGWDSDVTGRSRFTYRRGQNEKEPHAVTEITELGELKAFDSFLLENRYADAMIPSEAGGSFPIITYEREFISAIHQYLSSLAQLGVSPPFFVNCALLNIQGYFMNTHPLRFSISSRILEKDDILPPSVRIASESEFSSHESVAQILRPTFDFIWREFGFERSFSYTRDDDWDPERWA